MKILWVNNAVLLVVFSLFSPSSNAKNNLILSVKNQSGDPVEYSVISLFAQNADQKPIVLIDKIKVIDQVDKEFISHVLPIQLGTAISFPNHDQIRHHVYSFSKAKKFEIPLYKGTPASPVLFDKVGVVSLGCNIHDWMSAYIYVLDTPYFTMTDKKGQAALELPAGEYEIRYWHPNIDKKNNESPYLIKLDKGSEKTISVELITKKTWGFRRAPRLGNRQGIYR